MISNPVPSNLVTPTELPVLGKKWGDPAMNIRQVSDIRLVQRVQLCLKAQNSKEVKWKVLDNLPHLSSWLASFPGPNRRSRRKGLVSAIYSCAYSTASAYYFRTHMTPILILGVTLSVDLS